MKWLLKILTVMLLVPSLCLAQTSTFCRSDNSCHYTGNVQFGNLLSCSGAGCSGQAGACPYTLGSPLSQDCPPASPTAWDQEFNVPLAVNTLPAGWSFVNCCSGQVSAKVDKGVLEFTELTQLGINVHLAVESLSGVTTPWRFVTKFIYTADNCGFYVNGMALRDSVSGKFLAWWQQGNRNFQPGDTINLEEFNNATSFQAVVGSVSFMHAFNSWMWLMVEDTGTVYNFYWSMDGQTFTLGLSQNVGTWVTADQVGVAFDTFTQGSCPAFGQGSSFDYVRRVQ